MNNNQHLDSLALLQPLTKGLSYTNKPPGIKLNEFQELRVPLVHLCLYIQLNLKNGKDYANQTNKRYQLIINFTLDKVNTTSL